MNQSVAYKSRVKKLVSFLGVGLFNTIFNIVLFDVFVFLLGLGDLISNFLSLIISITISYFLNKILVFKDTASTKSTQLMKFFVGTFALQLVVQHGSVWLLGERYTIFGRWAYSFTKIFSEQISEQFIVLNTAKGLGVIFSIVISYLFYEKLVFTKDSEAKT